VEWRDLLFPSTGLPRLVDIESELFLGKIMLPLNNEIPGCFNWFRHRDLRIDQYGPQTAMEQGP
jgi:hypothetical protein